MEGKILQEYIKNITKASTYFIFKNGPVKKLQEEGKLTDEEVKEMLKVAYDKAKKIIEDHREVMDEIAEFLIEKETITGKEFMEIFHKYRLEQMERQVGMDVSDNTNE